MSEVWLHDNDVVVKLCGYQLCDERREAVDDIEPAILGTAKFSLVSQVARSRSIKDREAAKLQLDQFLKQATVIEAEADEIELAAKLEEEALRQALPLDTGESQLVAVLAARDLPLLLTGDKRAIKALFVLGEPDVDGRLACLEQLMATLLQKHGIGKIRPKICSEPEIDKTLTLCFSCNADDVKIESVTEGLASHVRHLRASSGNLLIAGESL